MHRSAWCLFCDDIRAEVGNKSSYMGVYGSDLFVEHIPVTMPKLCVAAWASTDMDDPFKELEFRIEFLDETKTVVLSSAELAKSTEEIITSLVEHSSMEADATRRLTLGVQAVISPFQIKREGPLRVRFQTEREEVKAGTIWLKESTKSQHDASE